MALMLSEQLPRFQVPDPNLAILPCRATSKRAPRTFTQGDPCNSLRMGRYMAQGDRWGTAHIPYTQGVLGPKARDAICIAINDPATVPAGR